MKRNRSILTVILLLTAVATQAGGLMTNTNYHIAFDRMFARGATFDIDAAYSNPAGLAWGHEGWQLSLNFQKPWQNRDIETTLEDHFLSYPNMYTIPYNQLTPVLYGGLGKTIMKFNGVASAPIVPALFASYKKDRWALSTMIGIVGSGGFVKYDEGIPMFNTLVMASIFKQSLQAKMVNPASPLITPDMLAIDSEVKGKQYIYGAQLNFTYKITDFLAAAVGLRANYYDGYSKAFVRASTLQQLGGQTLANLELDCVQRGWGIAPIVSVDFHQGPVTLAARYEFRTKLNTENETSKLPEGLGDLAASYVDGAHVRYDMPALFVAAVGYEFSPQLRASVEYHFFDDKHAKMAGDRQKELSGGTNEFLAGIEYDINDKFTVSCGGQRTDYGLSDGYQQNTSFACDSYSFGLGGAWNINDKMRLNISYFKTIYSDYTKEFTAEQGGYMGTGYPGKEVYSRTNDVIGIGLDYRF
jgi:long-chain fatty acid transport protein